MIVRIVKMTFVPEKVEQFLEVFNASKSRIRAFEGCHHLELWQASAPAGVLFTYSWWDTAASLERYRNSKLFKETWAQTKIHFADKPQAWSVDVLEKLD